MSLYRWWFDIANLREPRIGTMQHLRTTHFSVSECRENSGGASCASQYADASVNGATGPNYPNVIATANGPGTYAQWFNTAAFVNQPNNTWGSAGRTIGFGPGNWNFDTSLQREFKPIERITLQFRLESFDVTNTQSPANPNTTVGSTTFGQITSISGSRQQQVALKILF